MMCLTDVLCPDTPLHTLPSLHPKQAGDLVMISNNRGPIYEIIHLHQDQAWIRPISNGQECLAPIARLRVV